jgi:hypothetical protein
MAVLDHAGEFWTDAKVVWKWLFPPGSAAPGKFTGEAPDNHGSTLLTEPAKRCARRLFFCLPDRYDSDNDRRY